MRVFIDECVTITLMPHLIGHDFVHIRNTPWLSTKNGALLRLVQEQYDVFLTTDRHLPDQQNLRKFNLTFVIMRGVSNRIEDLLPLMPDTLAVLDTIRDQGPTPNAVYEINPRQK